MKSGKRKKREKEREQVGLAPRCKEQSDIRKNRKERD